MLHGFGRLVFSLRRCLSSHSISQILTEKLFNRNIQVEGWIESIRRHKSVTFIQLSDRSSLSDKLQIVINDADLKSSVDHSTQCGCFVKVIGKITPSKGAEQSVDLQAEKLDLIGPCDVNVHPHITGKNKRDLVEMRKYPHFRPRSEIFRAILSARSKASSIVHNYFEKNGYTLVHPPLLTQNRCEDGSEAFRVESAHVNVDSVENPSDGSDGFFGAPAYLTVSMQLHLEALCAGLGKVYSFSPTFRADHSNTRQHLAEFYMIEAEVPFVSDLDCLSVLVEDFVKDFIYSFHVKAAQECDIVFGEDKDLYKKEMCSFIEKPFKKLLYADASDLLLESKKGFSVPFQAGHDLTKEHELYLVEKLGAPVFVMGQPAYMKPFYMRTTEDETNALSLDLLLPNVAEVCGGSVREHDVTKLTQRLSPVQRETLDWYLDLRRVGSFPHAGFGIGFERLLQFALGLRNIRDTVAFPRFIGSCKS